MSSSNDFNYFVKEEIRDPLFEQTEDCMPVKKEPVVSLVSIKNEHKNIIHAEHNEDTKNEFCREIREDYDLHELVKQETCFPYYTNNLEVKHQEIVDTSGIKTENFKIEYHMKEDVKKEITVEVKEEFKYEDMKYNIDIKEHKIEYSADGDHTVTSNEDISRTRKSCGNKLSSKDENAPRQDTLRVYNCDICCKSFHQLTKLRRHVKVAHTYTQYEQNNCNKMFSSAQHHTVCIDSVHGGIKKYECKLCGKMFSSAQSLTVHTDSVHRGIKKYECIFCCKMFSHHGHLNTHTDSVHKGIKKYECKLCGKMFSQRGHLIKHTDSIHKGIKKYECKLCGKMFSRFDNLNRHINCVHKRIKMFECSNCHKRFSQKSHIKIHIGKVCK